MSDIFPLTEYPRHFIPTASANFIEHIINDILVNIFYPGIKEDDLNQSFPAILNINSFAERLSPDKAIKLVDDFHKKKFKKRRIPYFEEVYVTNKIYRNYIGLKPTCFLVLGKPSIDRYKSARKFAQDINRIHLDVNDIVNLEIASRTTCGKWIYTNLCEKKCIPINVVLHLVRQVMNQSSVQSRGYVLSGFPIIPEFEFSSSILPNRLNKMSSLMEPPLAVTEEWLRRNGDNIFDPPINIQSSSLTAKDGIAMQSSSSEFSVNSFSKSWKNNNFEAEATEEEDYDIEWKDNGIQISEDDSTTIFDFMNSRNLKNELTENNVKRAVRKQFQFLLHLDLSPDVIFFIRNKDDKRILQRGSSKNAETINLNKRSFLTIGTQLSIQTMDPSTAEFIHDTDFLQARYLSVLEEIDKFMMHYCKECIIKVDGRYPVGKAVEQFHTGMDLINYKQIHQARHIVLRGELRDEIRFKPLAECFESLRKENLIQPNLKLFESEFGTKCPVKLHDGKIEQGEIKFAAEYLGHAFLMSNFSSMKRFLRNPNEYFVCTPNCRIAIVNMDTNPISGLVAVFKAVFNADSFDWKEPINESPDVRQIEIYTEARKWAEDTLNSVDAETLSVKESLKEMTLLNWVNLFESTIEKLLVLLDKEYMSQETVDAIEFLNQIGVDTAELSLRNTLVALKNDADLRKHYISSYLNEITSANVVKDEQLIAKVAAVKFYELYKLKLAAELANQIIAWIQEQDHHWSKRADHEKTFAQWIIEDAPATIEYWETLERKQCLPDVVIILQSTWGINFRDSSTGSHIETMDIDFISSKIMRSFPNLFSQKEIDLKRILQNALQHPLYSIDSMNPLIRLAKSLTPPIDELIDQEDDVLINQLMMHLSRKNIPYILNIENGRQKGVLGLMDEYLKMFKPLAKKLSVSDITELINVDSAVHEMIPKMTNGYNHADEAFHLDLSYFKKDVSFESDIGSDDDSDEEEKLVQSEVYDIQGESTNESMEIDKIVLMNIENRNESRCLPNIPFGNTLRYCPVTYTKHHYLRLGKLSFSVEYANKLYMMATKEASEQFAENPLKYIEEDTDTILPPYRICVIGPIGPNKGTFSSLLSAKLNVSNASFRILMKDFLEQNAQKTQTALYSEDELYSAFGREFLTGCLKQRFKAGLILEGFPSNKQQFLDMMYHEIFPEMVFIVDCNPKLLLHNIFQYFYRIWEEQLKVKYKLYETEFADRELQNSRNDGTDEHSEWSERSALWQESDYEYENRGSSTKDSANEFPEEYNPKPIDYPLNPIPTEGELIEIKRKLLKKSRKYLKVHLGAIKSVLELCVKNNIPVMRIPRDIRRKAQHITGLFYEMCNISVRPYKFDQVLLISLKAAKHCLRTGYCLYSHFKNFCPVDAHNLMPINLHHTFKKKGELYACIYRNLLYYINGKENLKKFCRKPRLYTSNKNSFHLVNPMRIAVIGPECSGVSTLCQRVAKEFNMSHLNRNRFFRRIRDDLPHSNFYRKILERPPIGTKISAESISDSEALVECLHLHRNDSPNGIILDNYPVTPTDIIEAAESNICFHIVLIIKTDFHNVWRNWKTTHQQKRVTKYVSVLDELIRMHSSFRKYDEILKLYESNINELKLFNIVFLRRTNCIWAQWEDAKNEILICLREIGSYNLNLRSGKCVGITHLNIFESEFEKRLSPIELACPICLKIKRELIKYRYDYQHVGMEFYNPRCQYEFNLPYGYKSCGQFGFSKPYSMLSSPEPIFTKNMFKTNLVQFQGNFFWTCDEHHFDILLNANNYLPIEAVELPPYIPFLVTNYYAEFVQNDGYCIVSYSEEQSLKRGSHDFAIFYRGKIFLCASANCAIKFLEEPDYYYHQKIPRAEQPTVNWDISEMIVNYGNLTPALVIDALLALGEERPKHFGLNIANSAAIFLGLYFKTVNPVSKMETIKLYEEVSTKFINECALLSLKLKEFQTNGNPFILQNLEL